MQKCSAHNPRVLLQKLERNDTGENAKFQRIHMCNSFTRLLCCHLPFILDRLVGLVVTVSTSRAEDPRFEFRLRRGDFFSGVESYQWLQNWHSSGYPARCLYRVSAGTGWPGVSILWLGEIECLICNFYLSVAARNIVWVDQSPRYTSMLLGR